MTTNLKSQKSRIRSLSDFQKFAFSYCLVPAAQVNDVRPPDGADWVLFGSRPAPNKYLAIQASHQGIEPDGLVKGYGARTDALENGLQQDEIGHVTLQYLGKGANGVYFYKEVQELTFQWLEGDYGR